jgi:hypothetical protein
LKGNIQQKYFKGGYPHTIPLLKAEKNLEILALRESVRLLFKFCLKGHSHEKVFEIISLNH